MVDVAVRVGEEVWEKLWPGLNFNHQCECRASFRPSEWDVPISLEVQAGLGVVEKVLQWDIGPIDRRTKPRFHKIIRYRGYSYSGVSFFLPRRANLTYQSSRTIHPAPSSALFIFFHRNSYIRIHLRQSNSKSSFLPKFSTWLRIASMNGTSVTPAPYRGAEYGELTEV